MKDLRKETCQYCFGTRRERLSKCCLTEFLALLQEVQITSRLLWWFVPPWSNGMTCSRVAYCGWPGVPTKISPQIGQGRPILERTSECCCFVLFFLFFMVSPQVIPHTSLPHDVNHRGLRLLPQRIFLRLRVYKLQLSWFREVIRVNPTYLLLHIWRQY